MNGVLQAGVFAMELWCESCGSNQPHTGIPQKDAPELYLCQGSCKTYRTGIVQVQEEAGKPVVFYRVQLTDNLTITKGHPNAWTEDIGAEAEDQSFPNL